MKKQVTQQPNVPPKMKMSSGYVLHIYKDNGQATQIEKFNVQEDDHEYLSENDSVSNFESEPFETDKTSPIMSKGNI